MIRKKKKPITPTLAETVAWTVCLILFLIMLTALKGLVVLHMEFDRVAIGSSNSSLALLAAAISTALWGKCVHKLLGEHHEKK